MLGEIRKITRGKVKAMVVKTRAPQSELPKLIGESYGKITARMNEFGAMAAGAPYLAYFNSDMEDLQVEIGIPTGVYVPDTEEIVMSEIPEGDYLSAIFTGPYDQLMDAYGEMTVYMTEHKIQVTGGVYESYLNDPADTAPEALMTEIIFSI